MFTIAIIGRPNVGKSTLFNRLANKKSALTHDMPGVTRDRKEENGNLGSMHFTIIDTPGLEHKITNYLTERMNLQTEQAVLKADLAILLMDGKDGLMSEDYLLAKWIRKRGKNTILVINKCEAYNTKNNALEFSKLGLGIPICISAEHNEGMIDLYDAIEPFYESTTNNDEHIEQSIKIAIVGRPNSGKSTFFNKLLGEERVITGPEAGITRDATYIKWSFQNTHISLIDTAGMRRKSNIDTSLEKLSVSDSLKAIKYSHIVILLTDASKVLEAQDINIANLVINEGRGLIIAVNKWDTITDKLAIKDNIKYKISKVLGEIKNIPVEYISALHGNYIYSPIKSALNLFKLWNTEIPKKDLNNWLTQAVNHHPPALAKSKRRIRFKYITQNKVRPPTFLLFTNYPEEIEDSYIRYLSHSLREYFNLPGTPIRILLRKTKNPYI
ncbi:GTPase EngA [Rickettsiales bacterium Ac37b]|nr:GTPase EngA [Rickettsiales bacterium Ac37b]